jgi:hypothetical protein
MSTNNREGLTGLTNPERVDKWRARADEWARMAAQAENEHIGQHCLKEAEFCEMMAALWCKP